MSVLLVRLRILAGYIANLPGRVRRAIEWRQYTRAARKRSEAAKRGWVTRKQNIATKKYTEFLDRVHVKPEELAALAIVDEADEELRDCA